MKKAIFFDRDGVLNKLVKRDNGYFSPIKSYQFEIVPKAVDVLNYTKSKGFLNIVISNQPDISRGLLSEKDLIRMTDILKNKLPIDDVSYCIHDDGMCECRKPLPGLIFSAQNKWDIDLTKSIMVGDTWKDAEAAKNANLKCLLLNRDYNIAYQSANRINNLKDVINYLKREIINGLY